MTKELYFVDISLSVKYNKILKALLPIYIKYIALDYCCVILKFQTSISMLWLIVLIIIEIPMKIKYSNRAFT